MPTPGASFETHFETASLTCSSESRNTRFPPPNLGWRLSHKRSSRPCPERQRCYRFQISVLAWRCQMLGWRERLVDYYAGFMASVLIVGKEIFQPGRVPVVEWKT
ncbi:hypothetical protein BDW02DRAFT_203179 [Decorospora gaudefroyi]|uniref:Uncharacterized protein n=1 Tax=Decorospora gaudefroyi TaxID=184978 RepID=A0A6A5KP34_9PLEO|nr:hypothetical protein BDW02DRAFT_203179 [Decorospora gaudefroyi]